MRDDKLKYLLQSKCDILDNIGERLHEEEGLLEAGNAKAISAKCDEVNSLIMRLENINGRIASLGLSAASLSTDNCDEGLRHLFIRIIRQAETNRYLMDSLVDRALKSRDEIKHQLGCTVAASRISGYKPYANKTPVYLDKRN